MPRPRPSSISARVLVQRASEAHDAAASSSFTRTSKRTLLTRAAGYVTPAAPKSSIGRPYGVSSTRMMRADPRSMPSSNRTANPSNARRRVSSAVRSTIARSSALSVSPATRQVLTNATLTSRGAARPAHAVDSAQAATTTAAPPRRPRRRASLCIARARRGAHRKGSDRRDYRRYLCHWRCGAAREAAFFGGRRIRTDHLSARPCKRVCWFRGALHAQYNHANDR